VKTPPGHRETGRRGDKSSSRPVAASVRRSPPLITFLTDFGTADYFVAAVKGVILDSNSQARLVDITHDIPPQDIEAAAFTLLAACPTFPAGTIHLAVVDPGVGSSRRAILIQAREQFFIGPDNGIFSYVCEGTESKIFHLNKTKYFREPVSPTFNGRDVFAPVAAALSNGVTPGELGTKVSDYVKLKPLAPEISGKGKITGRIIHIDRFGNCVTNITQNELTPMMIDGGARLRVKSKTLKSFRTFFAQETGSREKVFAIWGSAGFLEIAAAKDSAAKILNVHRGDPVIVSLSSEYNL
jgi:S-adenosyl-L-methionine hydrolase (adenosine-forming)